MFSNKVLVLAILFSSISFCQDHYIFYPGKHISRAEPVDYTRSINDSLLPGKTSVRNLNGTEGCFTMTFPNTKESEFETAEDSVRLYLSFDNYCFILVLFNDGYQVDDSQISWNSSHTFGEVTVPAGIYQLFSYSEIPMQNKDIFIVKEDINVSQSDTIAVNYNDSYPVTVNNLDENGNPLSIINEFYWTPVQFYFAKINAHFTFQGFTVFNFYLSGFSPDVWFSCGLHRADLSDSKTIYAINHRVIKGLNGPETLTNDPADFSEHAVDCLSGKGDSSTVGFWDFVRFGGDYLFGWGAVNKIPGNKWEGKIFLTPFNSSETGFCTGMFAVDENRVYRFCTYGIQTENGSVFIYPMAGFYNTPPNTILYPSRSPITLGYTAGYTDALLYNSETTITLLNQYYGLASEFRSTDLFNSNYRLFDSGNNLIAQGIIGDTPTLYADQDKYTLQTTNKNSLIEDTQSAVLTTQKFNLKNQDKTPPFITSLNITDEDGIPQRHFEKNGRAGIMFSGNDPEGNLAADSVSVQVRSTITGHWEYLPCGIVLNDSALGSLYETDLTPLTGYDSAAVDLKITIPDLSGNATELLLEPAFTIGSYGIINDVIAGSADNTSEYSLGNYPNPFNPSTKIRYAIPQTARVSLIIYNLLGQEVKELVNEEKSSGTYEVSFNASGLSSGIYFYTLRAGQYSVTKKMLLLR